MRNRENVLAKAKRGVKRFVKDEQEAGRERLETLAILNTLGER